MKIPKKLFSNNNSVSQIIEIKGQPFQIIGVYKAEGGFMGIESLEMLIPLTQWPTLYGTEEIQNISVQAKNIDNLDEAGKKLPLF